MKNKLEEIAEIVQGTILTRVKSDNGISLEMVTMQQLSSYNDDDDKENKGKTIIVDRNKIKSLCISKENDIVFGLNSGKSMKICDKQNGLLVTSNFVRIRLKNENEFDPDYVCWVLNEDKDIKKYIEASLQGSTRVFVITLPLLKSLEIKKIPIENQRIIGKIYQLNRLKTLTVSKKEKIRSQIVKNKLSGLYKNI